VNPVIVFCAQYLIYALVAAVGVLWLLADRIRKVQWAAEAVLGLALVGLGIVVAAHLHADPRPFVSDPASTPLFPHPADNGFPSDHSAAAGLLAVLVLRYRRVVGGAVAVGAGLVAWARVAAHVHHAEDVVAGLAIGAAAGLIAVLLVRRLLQSLLRRSERLRTMAGTGRP
jgi:membrane-associated phospholipid phosphatase